MQSDGTESAEQPDAELDAQVPEGVVADKVFVEQLESEAQHSQEVLDEDDAFLGSAAPQVWEYDVVDDRADEFRRAIGESELVLEWEVIDDTRTEEDEAPDDVLATGGIFPPDPTDHALAATDEPTLEGSGVRAGDDGPAGMPTADPSAGGLGRGTATNADVATDNDLNVVKARDPRAGVTNRGKKAPKDWAADTGPTVNPEWKGVQSEKAPLKTRKKKKAS